MVIYALNKSKLILYFALTAKSSSEITFQQHSPPLPLAKVARRFWGNCWRRFLTPREPVKALFEIDPLRYPGVRNLDDAMDLETEIPVVRIRVILRKKATLSYKVLLVDDESAGVLFEVQEIATVDADFIVEHEYAKPDFEDQVKVRVEITFDLWLGG